MGKSKTMDIFADFKQLKKIIILLLWRTEKHAVILLTLTTQKSNNVADSEQLKNK